jgi:hypothetical protein
MQIGQTIYLDMIITLYQCYQYDTVFNTFDSQI